MSAASTLRPIFLVVEPDILVAHDICEMLQDFVPRAVLHRGRDGADAEALLAGLERLSAAFLCLPPSEMQAGRVARAAEGLGARVVVLDAPSGMPGPGAAGGAAGARERCWLHTGRPYGPDAVAAALRAMGLMAR